MSDVREVPAMLAAVPLGATEFGTPDYPLAVLPCLSSRSWAHFAAFSEEL